MSTSTFTFTDATRQEAKARVALAGPTGSGKTYTALLLAAGLLGVNVPADLRTRVAVVDTERGSASLYAGDPIHFRTLQLHKFDPRDLVKVLAAAGQAGFEVVIIDSLSHFWMGDEGMLAQVDNAAKRSYGGNSFGGWKEARPMERAMIDAILAYPGHVIATMRTKTEWVIEENNRGQKVPRKIGLKPEQRDNIEYEFTIVGDMDQENTLTVSKSRFRGLSGAVIRRPDGDSLGRPLREWLSTADPAPSAADYLAIALDPTSTWEQLRQAYQDADGRHLLGASVEDETGKAQPLGDLIIARGNAAKAAAEAAAEAAMRKPATPAADDTDPITQAIAEDAADVLMITDKQLRRLHALLTKRGIHSDEDRHREMSLHANRRITSAKDLTRDEAAKAIAIEEQPQQVPA